MLICILSISFFIQKKVGLNPQLILHVGCLIIVSLVYILFFRIVPEIRGRITCQITFILDHIRYYCLIMFSHFRNCSLQYFYGELTRANYKKYQVIFENIGVITNINYFT